MPAASRNILVEQGADFSEEFDVAFDLTGWTPRGQVRSDSVSGEVRAEFSCRIMAVRRLRIRLPSDRTALLGPIGNLYFDVIATKGGETRRVRAGRVLFDPWITRVDVDEGTTQPPGTTEPPLTLPPPGTTLPPTTLPPTTLPPTTLPPTTLPPTTLPPTTLPPTTLPPTTEPPFPPSCPGGLAGTYYLTYDFWQFGSYVCTKVDLALTATITPCQWVNGGGVPCVPSAVGVTLEGTGWVLDAAGVTPSSTKTSGGTPEGSYPDFGAPFAELGYEYKNITVHA
jgi:hypothetical protein